jgi:hypothetical protein
MYLEVMTWPDAAFDHHAIRGPLPELARGAGGSLLARFQQNRRQGQQLRLVPLEPLGDSFSVSPQLPLTPLPAFLQ